jgi:nitroimidazol reductase NimA-like FMN-containing flavoprotein (pyridoxamine 5'-phosphate oxidase superfamily)
MFRKMRRSDKEMSEEMTLDLLLRGEDGVLGTIGDNGYPYTVVVNYVYLNNKIYFHCAKTGYKIDNIKNNNKVSFTVYDNVEVVGDELTTKYQSLIVFGRAKVIEATKEVLLALINKYAEIDENKALKMIEKEISITSIVEIEIDHVTGKIGTK